MAGFLSRFGKDAKKIGFLLLLVLGLYHLALYYSLSHQPVLLSDSEEYIHSAQSFEKSNTFYAGSQGDELDYRLFSKRTPFYPIVLSGFHCLNLHWNFVYLLQLFLGFFNVYLSFILLSGFLKNTLKSYIFLTVFIVFTPSQFIYSQFIMADLWLQSFIMIGLVSFAKFCKTKQSYWLVIIIIISTLAALTKPVFLIASFLIAMACFWYFLKQKGYKYLAIVALIPFICWYGVSYQNRKLTGVFHYSSIGYINLLHYNTNLYLNKAIGKVETEKLLEPLMIVPHTKQEFKINYNKVNSVCKQALLKNIVGYTVYHAKGMIYFFLDPGRFDLYNFFRIEEGNSKGFLHKGANEGRLKSMFKAHPAVSVFLVLIFLINLIKTFGFLGFLWVQRKNRLVWAGAIVVLYIAFLTGPLGASRFALPVELIIICFAAGFYGKYFQNLKQINTDNLITSQNH